MRMSFLGLALIVGLTVARPGLAQTEDAQTAPQKASIVVDASAPRVAVSAELYGLFFEEINHAGEGGLYAELVQNRDMEANSLDEGWRIEGDNVFTPVDRRVPKWFDSDLPAWSLVAEGDAKGSMEQDTANPLNNRNPHSLRLSVQALGQRCGVANSGFWGINVEQGEWYDATFYARSQGNRRVGLVFSLESPDGNKVAARATLPEVGGGWRKYTLALQAYSSEPNCRLVISPIEPVTMWLDCVSLFPRKTFKDRSNGMRADVAAMLADLKPAFLRFPGGCVVEGITLHNRWRWRDSIGDIAQRQGGYDLWGYYNTAGLGFHEYLQLAEDLGAEAMYVINAGMTCQNRGPAQYAEGDELQAMVQDTLDALEYALGPADSEYGAQRAANGHPEPFRLKYVEIGNENRGSPYTTRYRVFYDAIKQHYPDILTIANMQIPDATVEIVDEHLYRDPRNFFQAANHYDQTDRNGPSIYVGEYAANRNVGRGNLLGALSEAVFMLNMEKNSDVVKMCSFAPLLENVNQPNWQANLILLDSSRVAGRSSYFVQKLFANHRPDYVLQTEVRAATATVDNTEVQQVYALGGWDQNNSEVVIKAVNPTPSPVVTSISLKGLSDLGPSAKVITLGHEDAKAENSLDEPNVIVPVEFEQAVSGPEFSVTLAPNSLTILRLTASSQ